MEPGSVNEGVFVYNTAFKMLDATTLNTFNLFGYGSSNEISMNVTGPTTVEVNFTDVAGRIFKGTGTLTDDVLTINITVMQGKLIILTQNFKI